MAFPYIRRGLGALAAVLYAQLAFAQVTLNADRAGNDIARFADADLGNAQCAARCESNAQCQAWVLVKDGSQGGINVCYLKSTVAMTAPNPCCDTGVKMGRATAATNGPVLQQRPLKGGFGAGPAQAGLQGGAMQGAAAGLGRAQAAEGGYGGSPQTGQSPSQRSGYGNGPSGQQGAGNRQAGNSGGFGGYGPGNGSGPGGRQQGIGNGYGGNHAQGGNGGGAPGQHGNGPGSRQGGGMAGGFGRAGGGQAGQTDEGDRRNASRGVTDNGGGNASTQAGGASNGGSPATGGGSPWGQPGSGYNAGWGPGGNPVTVESSGVSVEYTTMTPQQRDEKESTRIDAEPDKPKPKDGRPAPDQSSTPNPDGNGSGGNSRSGLADNSRATPTDGSSTAGGRAGGTGSGGARLQGGGFVNPQGRVDRVVNPSGNVGYSNLPLRNSERGKADFQDLHRGAAPAGNTGQESDEGTNDWRPPPVIP